jgi:hypothetical protein
MGIVTYFAAQPQENLLDPYLDRLFIGSSPAPRIQSFESSALSLTYELCSNIRRIRQPMIDSAT